MRKDTCPHVPTSQALLAVLLLLIAATPAGATFKLATCGEVKAWVEQHQDQLPVTLADFEAVPEGYEPGVFKALPLEQRNELWATFLHDFVEAQPNLGPEAIQDVMAFRTFFERPTDFIDLDADSHEMLTDLLASFTLRLIEPIADLAVDADSLGQLAIKFCTCNRATDPGCLAAICLPSDVGCGPFNTDPCDGRWNL